MILPVTSGDYAIGDQRVVVLSVRRWTFVHQPSPLALVSSARARFTGGTASLLVENGHGNTLWPQVVSVLRAKNYTPSPNA